jgi:secreted trypsin-like serine protease
MKILVISALLVIAKALPTPDDVVTDVFGRTNNAGYSGASADNYPDDFLEPTNEQQRAPDPTIQQNLEFEHCWEYTNITGHECVPYYQCSNGEIITDGTGLIDIRNGFGVLNAEDGKCPGFLDVCCKNPDFVATTTTTTEAPIIPVPYSASCGRRNVNGLGARISGFKEDESQVGEWPHMCALLREELLIEDIADGYGGSTQESKTVNHFVCGASLIEPGVVLTAGHCVDKLDHRSSGTGQLETTLKVRCGEWDTQTESEPYQHQDRYVGDIYIHPEFFGGALFNDVALLFMREPFVMDHNVDTICLPQPGETFVDDTCYATGWGKDKFGRDGNYQVILKEIDLNVTDNEYCQNQLRKTRLGKRFRLHPSFLCAGGGDSGKDTCKGDGGSPLVCPSKYVPNTYIQAGIVAWGIGCGEQGVPGVYADVAQSVCWIDYIMSGHGQGLAQGDFVSSYWGYGAETCGQWMEDKLNSGLPQGLLNSYQFWNVNWEPEQQNLVDISENARDESGDGYVDVSEPLTDDGKYNNADNNGPVSQIFSSGNDDQTYNIITEENREVDYEGNYSPENQINEQVNDDTYSDHRDTDHYNNDGSSTKHTDDDDDILVEVIIDSTNADNNNNEGALDDNNNFVEAIKDSGANGVDNYNNQEEPLQTFRQTSTSAPYRR